jgi:outer membrane lipoprotein-sorting protein
MNNDDHDNRLLDEMLNHDYERLRQPVLGQREALLSSLSQARASAQAVSRRTWRRPGAWLATAACLGAAISVTALWHPSAAGRVYGIEAVPERLLEVQTIRIRGWQMVYDHLKPPDSPPIRVPVEYLVKRPDKFRCSRVGISQGVGSMKIRCGSRICDGSTEWMIDDAQKRCVSTSVSTLEARLKTEMAAQQLIMLAALGPPDASYKKRDEETIGQRQCNIYETRFGETRFGEGNTIIVTVWVDRTSGDLVRVVHDEVRADGTTRRTMEFDDIFLNLPLADQLFAFAAPEGYKTLTPTPAKADPRPLLDPTPNLSASGSGDTTLEAWQAFRITDDAGLLIWRRSAPVSKGDGTRDWLSNVEIKLVAPQHNGTLGHAWLYQSDSSEGWNWSVVAMKGGRWPNQAAIRLEVHGKQVGLALELVALRFSDQELERLVIEASRTTLPEAHQYSLEEIRKQARKLLSQ